MAGTNLNRKPVNLGSRFNINAAKSCLTKGTQFSYVKTGTLGVSVLSVVFVVSVMSTLSVVAVVCVGLSNASFFVSVVVSAVVVSDVVVVSAVKVTFSAAEFDESAFGSGNFAVVFDETVVDNSVVLVSVSAVVVRDAKENAYDNREPKRLGDGVVVAVVVVVVVVVMVLNRVGDSETLSFISRIHARLF